MARQISIETLAEGIQRGDRAALGRAITLAESTRPEHQKQAQEILAQLISSHLKPNQPTLRIGISGAPGVGKSTFIEAFGSYLVEQGKTVAVLAVDPSSQSSRGSILGDKTRMEKLSAHPAAFIRPSPAGTQLGGVARRTRDALALVEAAGFQVVIVETVGVGQSETAVHDMTDIFLLLLLPGAGDDLQGIKRGIVEMADLLVVNKADGERRKLANQARGHYLNAVHQLPPKPSGIEPNVLICSALEQTGIAEIWLAIQAYQAKTQANGFFEANRAQQLNQAFREALEGGLQEIFFENEVVQGKLKALEQAVLAGNLPPQTAAQQLLRVVKITSAP